METRLVVVVALGFLIPACKREREPGPTPAVVETPTATPTSSAKSLEPSKDVSQLVARLRSEAANRVASEVSAEKVFDAFEHAGIVLDSRRQYAGFTMNATYCAGGRTADGVALAVCEYPTAKAANDGKAYMDQRFAAMASSATRQVHGTSVLTVAQPRGDVAARAFAAFNSL